VLLIAFVTEQNFALVICASWSTSSR